MMQVNSLEARLADDLPEAAVQHAKVRVLTQGEHLKHLICTAGTLLLEQDLQLA